jgi:hypothetical protein
MRMKLLKDVVPCWLLLALVACSCTSRASEMAIPATPAAPVAAAHTYGREFHVAADGKPANAGTRESPWDLESMLTGQQHVDPGSTVWVSGGTYRPKTRITVNLTGRDGAPIIVRAKPGERATVLDTWITVEKPSAYLWIWGLEITGTTPMDKRKSDQADRPFSSLPPSMGITDYSGKECKFINLIVHDNVRGAVGADSNDAIGTELHGCIIYNNGWKGPDRGHGHCYYVQNKVGVKTVSGCIMSCTFPGQYTMHAYGSSNAYLDNLRIEDNIAYDLGPFLIGGGRASRNLKVNRNYLHGIDMEIGNNEDCDLRNNVVVKGKIAVQSRKVVDEGNIRDGQGLTKGFVIPNKYDPFRAHLAVYNSGKQSSVAVDVSSFLKPGDAYRLMNPRDFFGKPVSEGTYAGGSISVPMAGEFAPFVLIKK